MAAGTGSEGRAGGEAPEGGLPDALLPAALDRHEKLLLYAVYALLGLLLLTPLIVTYRAAYSTIVGKAVYSRALIEIMFALWAPLALGRRSFRPPRSRLLALLFAGFGVALLAACFGASLQRSLWSNFERMQGLVDLAHWLVFVLVLVSVVRSARDWRILLGINLGVSSVVGLIAIGMNYEALGALYQLDRQLRVSASLGNPVYLGAYMQANILIGLGLFAHSFVRDSAPSPAGGDMRRKTGLRLGSRTRRILAGSSILVNGWALALTASFGALMGLAAGVGFLAATFTALRVWKVRWSMVAACGVFIASALVLVVSLVSERRHGVPDSAGADASLVQRWLTTTGIAKSYRTRADAWEAGAGGFLERPVLGWGPENFIVPLGKHSTSTHRDTQIYDYAHSVPVEEAATKGLAGVLAFLAIWGYAFRVIVIAAKRLAPGERIFALLLGGALTGFFAQGLTFFPTTTSSLMYFLLVGGVIRQESLLRSPERISRAPERLARFAARAARSKTVRLGVATLAVALAAVGLGANRDIYDAARYYSLGLPVPALAGSRVPIAETREPSIRFARLERSIATFSPLALLPRRAMFDLMTEAWSTLWEQDPDEALELLRKADLEVTAALRAEPGNWRIHYSAARMYSAAMETFPQLRDRMEFHAQRFVEMAPAYAAVSVTIEPVEPG